MTTSGTSDDHSPADATVGGKADGTPDRQPDEQPGAKAAGRVGPPQLAADAGRAARKGPVFPEQRVRVSAWSDPVLDRLGHDPRSGYVEHYWLSILGPSCLLLLRRLAAELERQPDGFELETVQWAQELGIGMKGGKNGPFWRAIERACRFGAAQRNGDLLAMRRRLPPLTSRQVERLPAGLRQSHHRWTEARLTQPRRPTVSKWSADRNLPPDNDRRLDDAA